MKYGDTAVDKVLEIKNLKKYFPVRGSLLSVRPAGWVRAVDDISFSISPGETMALAGESGCGKTTTTKVVLLLEKPTSGNILFKGTDIIKANREELKQYHRSVQAVFQDPYSSLNPRHRIGSIVAEPVKTNTDMSQEEVKERVKETLAQVGLSRNAEELFPHEFSGGQRQRIAIARALSLHPDLMILDEPVSALDVSIRAQIMNLLRDLQQELGIAFLLIAHDLATVRYMCHHIVVMYLGKIVEKSNGEEIFTNPLHPYTRALLSAALPSHPDMKREEIQLPGEVPSPLNPPLGCRFHPRCPQAMPICPDNEPELKEVSSDHWVACHLY